MVDKLKNEIVTINGDSYYFDKDNGRRVTGRQYLDYANHKYFGYYYFDKDGKMVKMTSSLRMAIFTTLMLLVINLILSLSQISRATGTTSIITRQTKGFSAPIWFPHRIPRP